MTSSVPYESETIEDRNPATGELLADFAVADEASTRTAVANAVEAFHGS